MSRRFLIVAAVIAAAFIFGSINTYAQGAPVRGKVVLKKADGSETPVEGAVIEAFRTDSSSGTIPPSKTNRRGEFSFVMFPYAQTYALSVSGTAIGPKIEPNVRAGREDIVIVVSEGDGTKLTEAEVRDVISRAGSGTTEELTAADKKAREEFDKKNQEIAESNKKIQQSNEIAVKSNSEGNDAFNRKDYDLAIAKYDEGITAVPNFVGSTPIMLKSKANALRARGFEKYRKGVDSPSAERAPFFSAANADYDAALEAFERAVSIVKNAPAATDPKEQQIRNGIMLELFANAVEVHRLKAIGEVDVTKGDDAAKVIEEYLTLETDAAKKAAAELTLGDILRVNQNCDGGIVIYKRIIEGSAESADALAGAGLCLFNVGYSNENKEQMQEGLNYLQRFLDIAPSTHRLKPSVEDVVKLLKEEQKLTPQKTPRTNTRRRP